ncbi:AraC family transcriptional regulator [Flammeovirgaceae bacterium SG7u.111]|nr:AraC family transcriptional regulator [Flammeovirgaceae bacterium SG7u.132]WPO37273.1 AraC family transcriptional regulator [Flammeovirgaceae bacterium SG7u.111]
MERLALKTFKSTYFKGSAIAISFIFSCIFLYFSSIKDQIIFPNLENYTNEYYTDSANEGKSQILNHIFSDSTIRLEFLLKEGFYSPYVGLSIAPSSADYIEAGQYNEIRLNISGENIDRVGIAFYMPPLTFGENTTTDQALYHSYLTFSDQPNTYSIPLSQFKHPEWWEDLHQIPESEKNKPDLDHILHINIGSAFSPSIEEEKAIEIRSIVFTRNNQSLYMLLGSSYAASISMVFGILYLMGYKKNKQVQVTVSYKPLELEDKPTGEEKCIEYINQNFHNSKLNLELVTKETGMPQRRITNSIQEEFQCNFKTYINRIRINEAKRLLDETSLHIGEVAYKVGFNNQSHFNRVFKAEMGINPSEYRENKS